MLPIKLFFSYSHADEELRDQLATHLKLMERQGLLAGWHDRAIPVGTEWNKHIVRELEEADIILLLISADFLASDYCWDVEVTRAMERHEAGEAVLVPVLLRPCAWEEAPFAKYQGLPRDVRPVTEWDNRDQAWVDVVRGIRQVVDRLTR